MLLGTAGARGPELVDHDGVRVDEAGQPRDHLHPVAVQLCAHHLGLPPDDVLRAGHEVADGDLVLDPVALPVELALAHAGQVEHRLAQRLGRDRAGVETDAPDGLAPVDDGHPSPELRRRDRGALSARAGADHQEVIVSPAVRHALIVHHRTADSRPFSSCSPADQAPSPDTMSSSA
jgi:hypothetical protein